MLLKKERKLIVEFGLKLVESNLTHGSGGNISIRNKDKIAISPSGIPYSDIKEENIVIVDLNGQNIEGKNKASSELSFHLALYKKRKEITSVVHTHSTFASTIATLGLSIPPCHYLIAHSGNMVPIAPYALFGTDKLAKNIIKNIKNYNAILLEKHGLVSIGKNIENAFNVALEIEFLAQIYYNILAINPKKIPLLNDKEIDELIKKFKDYSNETFAQTLIF